ncbi:MAG: hypothetical protein AAGI69_10095 [Cyanobacteria bacterium P01_H01_bin.21]
MKPSKSLKGLSENNKHSLNKLTRTLNLTGGRRFELVLAKANYIPLRNQILEELRRRTEVSIETLQLPRNARQLYTRLQSHLDHQSPDAICILGLESVKRLEELLLSTNQVREEFRKNFSFPIIIWVTDEVLSEIIRLVPDFHNWSTPISFQYEPEELVELLEQRSKQLFLHILSGDIEYPAEENLFLSALNWQEIKENFKAKQELESLNHSLSDDIVVTLKLGIGREHYRHNRFAEAETSYRECLEYWRNTNEYEKQGIILVHLGFAAKQRGEIESRLSDTKDSLWAAESYFRESLKIFESASRMDLVACFLRQLGEILQDLDQWDDLELLVRQSLHLHELGQPYADSARLARDYGFLAQIALNSKDWMSARKYAENALESICLAPETQRQHQPQYQLILAKALQRLKEVSEATSYLEKARQHSKTLSNPILRISILEQLREVHIAQKNYLSAFEAKQEQRSIENQYGLSAFIGANRLQPRKQLGTNILSLPQPEKIVQEIAVSDRQRDINQLIDRIARDNFKLTIIHGQSGVGKSSTVRAGLVPILRERIIKTRDVLTVTLQYYDDWVNAIGHQLSVDLGRYDEQVLTTLDSSTALIEQLKQNQYRFISVLILDQFEEFFIGNSNREERKTFLYFLSQCFKVPFVKVILILREDYIHYLLEFEHLSGDEHYIIDNILSSNHRYEIGNFSPEDAKAIIKSLTGRTQFNLEDTLVDKLVNDLASNSQEVRPIELQIVGAQLQAEDITTLAEYNNKGPKSALVQRYLEEVVKDCGPENQETANLILYLLTDENETRPPKTRDELELALKALVQDLVTEVSRLDLVLKIFVKSGLVFLLPSLPANRYQLVHDYLVSYIRRQQAPRISELTAKLEEERELRQRAEKQKHEVEQQRDELKELNAKLHQEQNQRLRTESDLKRARKRIRRGSIASTISIAIAVGLFSIYASFRAKTVSILFQASEIERDALRMLKQFDSDPLTSLVTAMEYVQDIEKLTDNNSRRRLPAYGPAYVLHQFVNGIQAKNKIPSKPVPDLGGPIHKVLFIPDGKKLLTISQSGTIRYWNAQGEEIASFSTTTTPGISILDIDVNRDGKRVATASDDGVVRVWNSHGKLIDQLSTKAFGLHRLSARSFGLPNVISLSSDGKYIAIASEKEGVKLWNLETKELSSLGSLNKQVSGVEFRPQDNIIAIALENGDVELLTLSGLRYRTLKEGISKRSSPIRDIGFDPTGQLIAVAFADGSTQLWDIQKGLLLSNFGDHEGGVIGVSFSADGEHLATASADNITRIWDITNGQQVHELKGHSNEVLSVDFHPQKKHVLATSSADGTVLTWDISDKKTTHFRTEENAIFNVIQFSNNGRYLAAGDVEGILYLWDLNQSMNLPFHKTLETQKPYTFQAHEGPIYSIGFSRDEQFLTSTASDEKIIVFDIPKRQVKNKIALSEQQEEQQLDIDFTSDHSKIVSVSSLNGIVRVWDWTKNLVTDLTTLQNNPLYVIKHSSTGDYIAVGGAEGKIAIWENNSEKPTIEQTIHRFQTLDLAFTSDNQYLLTASVDGDIGILSLKNIRQINALNAHSHPILDIEVSPNDQIVATSSDDGNIRLWEVDGDFWNIDKKQLAEYSYDGPIHSIKFSPDGRQLVVTSANGGIDVWKIYSTPKELLEAGCEWLEDFRYSREAVQKSLHMCRQP